MLENASLALRVWIAVVVTSFVVTFAALGYVTCCRLSNGNISRPLSFARDFEAALPRYREHIRILVRLRDAVEAERLRTGRYPGSREPSLMPVNVLIADHPHVGEAIDFKLPGPGSLLYRSDGVQYKMLLSDTGDCFVARILSPDMSDPRRSPGPYDCVFYGYWSRDGRDF